MVSKKGKGARKGKQPAPKKAKTITPALSGDESEDLVNQAIVQHLEALVQKQGVLVSLSVGMAGDKRMQQTANTSFQAQVLAHLAAVEDNGSEVSGAAVVTVEKACGVYGNGQPMGDARLDTTQMVVYKVLQSTDGKPSEAQGVGHLGHRSQ